jgi:hypothetical protein
VHRFGSGSTEDTGDPALSRSPAFTTSSPQAKQGILTANATTPYFIAFADLTRMGPIVLDVAAGPSAGSCVRTNVRDTDRHG